jgi:hypothetical protein
MEGQGRDVLGDSGEIWEANHLVAGGSEGIVACNHWKLPSSNTGTRQRYQGMQMFRLLYELRLTDNVVYKLLTKMG